MKRRKQLIILGILVIIGFNGTVGFAATGRIAEFREEFKKDPQPVLPEYMPGVLEAELYDSPSPDQMYSYAKDSEAWTKQTLTQLRNASVQADDTLENWIGDPILVVIIDFGTNTAYTATFSTETGEVEATYEDTKTELWASLLFMQDFLAYASQSTEEDTIDYAMDRYYSGWGVWVQVGALDIMLTPDTIYSVIVVGGIVGFLGYRHRRRRR